MSKPNPAMILNFGVIILLSIIQAMTGYDDLVVIGLLSGISYLTLLRRLEQEDAND